MVAEYVNGTRDGNWTEIPDSVAEIGFILDTIDGNRYKLVQIDHKVGGHGCCGMNSSPADQYVIGKLELVSCGH